MLLGVFGGTFDPIHNGHLMVANEAAEHLGLDRILFVPAGNPWLKDGTDITDSTHRLAMVHLGIAGNDRLEVSDDIQTITADDFTDSHIVGVAADNIFCVVALCVSLVKANIT